MRIVAVVTALARASTRSYRRRAAGVIVLALAAACQGNRLEPGDTLTGHWFNADAKLDANSDSVIFTARCQRAKFGRIVLDANLAFQAQSTSFTEIGNIIVSPGDQLRIQGTIAGGQMNLTILVVRTAPPVSDPIAMMLQPGRSSDPLVCNA